MASGEPVEDLKARTKQFALRIIGLVAALANNRIADVLGKQLLRSGTSVGANYRAARRARSTAEFCSKMGIVEEEADESAYWMELLIESGQIREALLKDLLQEANQLVAITVSSIKTARRRSRLRKG